MTERLDPSGRSESPQPSSRARQFYRSRSNRVLAGVCGGIAEYYGSDATAVRLLTLVLGLFTGIFPMIVVYLVAAVVVPDHEGASGEPARPQMVSGQLTLLFGALLILVGIGGLAAVWLQIEWNAVWPLVLIGIGAAVLFAATRPGR